MKLPVCLHIRGLPELAPIANRILQVSWVVFDHFCAEISNGKKDTLLNWWIIFAKLSVLYISVQDRSNRGRKICLKKVLTKIGKKSSHHWAILIWFCVLFVQWIFNVKRCQTCVNLLFLSCLSPLEPFWLTMTSITESFNPSKHTPLYKTNKKWERNNAMETTKNYYLCPKLC